MEPGSRSEYYCHVITDRFKKMAASSVNIYSPLSRLRRDNQTLLSQLKQGQNDTWDVLKRMRPADDSFVTRTDGESSFTYRGADRTPVSVTRRTDQGLTKAGQTSTPKNFGQALLSGGNDRRNRTSVVPVSILSTPGNRKKVSVNFKQKITATTGSVSHFAF